MLPQDTLALAGDDLHDAVFQDAFASRGPGSADEQGNPDGAHGAADGAGVRCAVGSPRLTGFLVAIFDDDPFLAGVQVDQFRDHGRKSLGMEPETGSVADLMDGMACHVFDDILVGSFFDDGTHFVLLVKIDSSLFCWFLMMVHGNEE